MSSSHHGIDIDPNKLTPQPYHTFQINHILTWVIISYGEIETGKEYVNNVVGPTSKKRSGYINSKEK